MLQHLLILFLSLQISLNASENESLSMDGGKNSTYLNLDNQTMASFDQLDEDPFLILRKKPRQYSSSSAEAWNRWATLDLEEKRPLAICSDEEETSHSLPLLCVTNREHRFDSAQPTFFLNSDFPTAEKVWWQISENTQFSTLSMDVIQNFTRRIALDHLDETFLNPNKEYFFRAKAFYNGTWNNWSTPFPFNVIKPEAVVNLHFEKINDSRFELVWEEKTASSSTYLIFGSNSKDFMPSIYDSLQVDAILDNEIAAAQCPQNFVGETKANRYPIDGNYAFYRIIACEQGRFSIPSPLIPFYDAFFYQDKDVLHSDGDNLAIRKKMTPAYPWLQEQEKSFNAPKYVQNALVSEEVWQQIHPFLLPDNHPIKKSLDQIFRQSRVLESTSMMKLAGFDLITHTQNSMKIASHPRLKGYLIKAYLDSENVQEWLLWKRRIEGAQVIQKSIDQHGFGAIMKVPKKWIYPLPPKPKSKAAHPRQFILVVEDMRLLSNKKNLAAYKKKITPEKLDALYILFTENLLIDSVFADNVPFSKDDKIAFIDTEHFNDTTQPLRLYRFAQYLSPQMHAYWEALLIKGGPDK